MRVVVVARGILGRPVARPSTTSKPTLVHLELAASSALSQAIRLSLAWQQQRRRRRRRRRRRGEAGARGGPAAPRVRWYVRYEAKGRSCPGRFRPRTLPYFLFDPNPNNGSGGRVVVALTLTVGRYPAVRREEIRPIWSLPPARSRTSSTWQSSSSRAGTGASWSGCAATRRESNRCSEGSGT